MNFHVIGTYRKDACQENSRITGLVLAEKFNGFTVHDLEDLKPLADAGRLWVHPTAPCGSVPVRIFWVPAYGHYVATTRPDGKQCNNLLSLTIYFASSRDGTVTMFNVCSR